MSQTHGPAARHRMNSFHTLSLLFADGVRRMWDYFVTHLQGNAPLSPAYAITGPTSAVAVTH